RLMPTIFSIVASSVLKILGRSWSHAGSTAPIFLYLASNNSRSKGSDFQRLRLSGRLAISCFRNAVIWPITARRSLSRRGSRRLSLAAREGSFLVKLALRHLRPCHTRERRGRANRWIKSEDGPDI